MISFECDYNNGAHPKVLEALVRTNGEQTLTYGFDSYSERAKEKIRRACECDDAEVFLLVGGTQTNTTVIDGMLQAFEAVISCRTGHIAIHEAGAIERVWEGVRFSALFSPAGDGRPGGIPCGGRAGFKTGPYSVVEGSRTRPDAFFGKYVDFGVRRVPGAFSRVWEGVRFSALSPRPSRPGIPRPGPRPR